ncbi:hypothetical protein FACS1894188_07340 [Clostridia bacterium]|nr:hypothetical protein FACS1894188_07340 [Clostridia bacterium]
MSLISALKILQYVSTIVSGVLLAVAMIQWDNRRIKYLFSLCVCVFLMCAGTTTQIYAHTLNLSLMSTRVMYGGFSFIGVAFYAFGTDYRDRAATPKELLILAFFPIICEFFMFTYPLTPFIRQMDAVLSYNVSGEFYFITAKAGFLHYLNVLYNIALIFFTVIKTAKNLKLSKKSFTEYTLTFIIPVFVIFILNIILNFGFFGQLPTEFLLCALYTAFVCLCTRHTIRFTKISWRDTGRVAAIQSSRAAFILVDNKDCFCDANEQAKEYFPSLKTAKVGTKVWHIADIPPSIFTSDENTQTVVPCGETGEDLILRTSRSIIEYSGRNIGSTILIFDDTENHKLIERMRVLAQHDALTGLYNRGSFFELATRDFDICRRKRENGAVLMLDLDHFKNVNDTYGHNMGDLVLITVSKIVLTALRHTDICGRYGGEEIVVWLPHTDLMGAVRVAEGIRENIANASMKHEKTSFHITTSIGVSALDYRGTTPKTIDELISNADSALYTAKSSGRNQVRVFNFVVVDA